MSVPIQTQPQPQHEQNTTHAKSAPSSKPNVTGIVSAISKMPTTRERLGDMLKAIDHDAEDRFVASPSDSLTSFGLNDAVLSNEDLSDLVDRVFTGVEAQAGWVDTYVEYLIEVGQKDLSTLEEQNGVIQPYFKALEDLAKAQGELLRAYKKDVGRNVTNLGVQDPSAMAVLDKVTMKVLEEWAEKKFGNGSMSKNVNEKRDNGTTDNKVGYTKEQYGQYLSANQTVGKLEPEFEDLDNANKIAAQGYLYKKSIPTWPAIFNLSMITGGSSEPGHAQNAQYDAAWSADVINSTTVPKNETDKLQNNFDNNLNSTTLSDGDVASSINSEAPKKTEAPSDTKSSNTTQTKDPSKSTSTTPTPSPSHVDHPKANSTAGGKREELSFSLTKRKPKKAKDKESKKAKTNKPASGALRLVAQNQQSSHNHTVGSGWNPSKAQVEPPGNHTTTNTNSTHNQDQDDDPLAGIQNTPLVGDMVLVSIDPGAWANRMKDNIAFGFKEQPEIAKKYFGEPGPKGDWDGPLGKMWKYVVLVMTYEPNSTDIQSVQVLGKVYEVTPGLKDVKIGSGGDKNSTNTHDGGNSTSTIPDEHNKQSHNATSPQKTQTKS